MKIALISSPRQVTPPVKYGGIELVVSTLAEELHMLGHDVTLLASGDSKTSATLYSIQKEATQAKTHHIDTELESAYDFRSMVTAADFLETHEFDIIHNNAEWLFLPFARRLRSPVVTTCHKNYKQAPAKGRMLMEFKELPYVSISNSQRELLPELNYVSTIHHGIDLGPYEFNDTPEDYLLFLGRITPQKNLTGAIEIAKRTNTKLLIAAKIDLKDEPYYKAEIEPLIDGESIVYLGEVGLSEKVKLLKNAKALLSPVTWSEPFGMVNIEAMACGTPVIGSNWGALPEIITPETGFACDTLEDMCSAVERLDTIERRKCRERVEERFNARTMTHQYVELYKSLLGA